MSGKRFSPLAALGLAALLGGLLAACDHSPAPAAPEGAALSRAALNRQLAELRQATARFHDFGTAAQAGYTFLFMNTCMVDQSAASLGGMGLHYVNTALLDGVVSLPTPEALLYEPGPDGQLRLVAVEYVIPKDAWTGEDPPVLFGEEFTLNAFDLWALHVWVWKPNPSGTFAAWNPDVSCP